MIRLLFIFLLFPLFIFSQTINEVIINNYSFISNNDIRSSDWVLYNDNCSNSIYLKITIEETGVDPRQQYYTNQYKYVNRYLYKIWMASNTKDEDFIYNLYIDNIEISIFNSYLNTWTSYPKNNWMIIDRGSTMIYYFYTENNNEMVKINWNSSSIIKNYQVQQQYE